MRAVIIYMCVLTVAVFAQTLQEAPEKWSVPERIDIINQYSENATMPYISADGQKIYMRSYGISVSEKTDTGWAYPYKLNDHFNNHIVENPVISPNGKRLYFTWYYPSWTVWYSDWDDSLNDWGAATYAGYNVNWDGGRAVSAPDDSTLIVQKGGSLYLSTFDKENGNWSYATKWPDDIYGFATNWGAFIQNKFEKVYLNTAKVTNVNGNIEVEEDITLCYIDSSRPSGYSILYKLNISNWSDSMYYASEILNRWEAYPSLSADGKTMIFLAKYDSISAVYESHMIIDENGNPLSVEREEKNSPLIPDRINFYDPFPNPFNPEVNIEYEVLEGMELKLAIYNLLGEEIWRNEKRYHPRGNYTRKFNMAGYSSGIYLLGLFTSEENLFRKIILIK